MKQWMNMLVGAFTITISRSEFPEGPEGEHKVIQRGSRIAGNA